MEKFKPAKLRDCGGDLSLRWYVDYYFEHPETGKLQKFREWLSVKLRTRQERYLKGREICARINGKLRTGWSPFKNGNDGKSVALAFTEVLDLKRASTGWMNFKDYRKVCKSFTAWLEANRMVSARPAELSVPVCTAYMDAQLARGVGARTYNNYLNTLRAVWNVLIAREYCEVNPWVKIPRLQAREADIRFVTERERARLRDLLQYEHPELYAASLLVYYCFLRPVEICRLRISDINLVESSISVRASGAKNGRNYQLVLPPDLCEVLGRLGLEKYPADWYVFAQRYAIKPGPVLNDSRKLGHAWHKIVQCRYGIRKKLYDLKPTGAALAIEAGINPRDIQLQMRHYSLEVTQIYLNKVSRVASRVFAERMPAF